MKRLATIIHSDIKNDTRVKNIIATLSKKYDVTALYLTNDKSFKQYKNHKEQTIKYPNSLLRKILRHSLFFYEYNFVFNELEKHKLFDIVYCNDLPTLNIGIKYKNKYGSKLIYDSHEIYNETINQFFTRSSNPIKNLIFQFLIFLMKNTGAVFEKKAIQFIDTFITVNTSLAEYFKKKYNLPYLPEVIMNFPPAIKINSINPIDFRKIFNWETEDIVFLYQGALNYGRGLELLVEAFVNTNENKKLVIVGDGILKQNLEEIVSKSNADRKIVFMGMIASEKLIRYTLGADVGIMLLENTNLSKEMASPNKLFQYIQAGLPFVATSSQETLRIVRNSNIAWLVQTNKSELEKILNNITQSEINTKKENILNLKNKYIWETQEERLLRIINIF